MAYNMYGQTGWNPQQQMGMPQYSYGQQPMQPSFANAPAMIPQKPAFVDGEMAARVFQMPENWPPMVPLYLWDMSGDVFYMKMIGQNGVPMPLRIFDFREREPAPSGYLSGNAGPDMSQYVTKSDLDQRFNEIKQMMQNNQNGTNNQQNQNQNQNRGANR